MQRPQSPPQACLRTWRRRVAVTLTCAVSAGCLVTSELNFDPNRNPAQVILEAPAIVSSATTIGDEDCKGVINEPAIHFRAGYVDQDVEQTLYMKAFVNGEPYKQGREFFIASPDPLGTAFHVLQPLLCIPVSRLVQPCNHVQVFVTDDFNKINTLLWPTSGDPDFDTVEWLVGPIAGDSPSGFGNPRADFSDCLYRDGGA